jgi:integrase
MGRTKADRRNRSGGFWEARFPLPADLRCDRETGARRDEVLSLQHWQIDRVNKVVTFAKRTKNGKSTVAPLTDRALEAIDSIPALPGCPYVFYNSETRDRWFDARKPWVAARKAAGYPWLRVRDLRPAFGIEAAEKGVPMHFIQSALGHSSVAVTERYYTKFAPNNAANVLRETVESARKAALAQPVAQKGKNEVAA